MEHTSRIGRIYNVIIASRISGSSSVPLELQHKYRSAIRRYRFAFLTLEVQCCPSASPRTDPALLGCILAIAIAVAVGTVGLLEHQEWQWWHEQRASTLHRTRNLCLTVPLHACGPLLRLLISAHPRSSPQPTRGLCFCGQGTDKLAVTSGYY